MTELRDGITSLHGIHDNYRETGRAKDTSLYMWYKNTVCVRYKLLGEPGLGVTIYDEIQYITDIRLED